MKTLKKNSLLLILFILFYGSSSYSQNKNMDKPNVVLIYLDDIGSYNFPTYGGRTMSARNGTSFTNVEIKTPNIDNLSRTGLRCDRAYTHAVCEPSRIALMTGQNNGRNYIYTKGQHQSQITFGDVFQKEGYVTGIFGKWKQTRGNASVPALEFVSRFGWDEHLCFDVHTEGQRFINPHLVKNNRSVNYKGRTDNDPETGRRWYGPDIINRAALNFIEENKNDPFFLYYPMLLVHDPNKPTPDTKPRSVFDNYPEENNIDDIKFFPDMLAYTDKLVGKVINKLEETGIRDNTIVVFLSDNGSINGIKVKMEDGRVIDGGKGNTRYSGESVPLIFNWPGKINPGAYKGVTNVTDVFPTIAEVCNLTIPNGTNIDGKSMWPQVSGRDGSHHNKEIYRWYNSFRPMTDTSERVRYAINDKYKYYAAHDKYTEGRLFNIQEDPLEQEGEKGEKVAFNFYWYSGIDLNNLNSEQEEAYLQLKRITDENSYKAIKGLDIKGNRDIVVGEKIDLDVDLTPADVTLNNVIWESDNENIATIDKFGVVTGKSPGEVKITVFSWDKARPAGRPNIKPEFKRDGCKDIVSITVGEAPAESILCNGLPTTIDLSKQYTASIDYSVNVERDIVLALFKGNNQWVASARNKVSPGAGILNINLTSQNDIVEGDDYYWILTIRPVGGNSSSSVKQCRINNVVAEDGTLSTDDILKENIKIYPNPVQEKLIIESNLEINTNNNLNIKIFNLSGAEVKTRAIDKGLNTLNVSLLSSGIYFLQIISDTSVYTSKFIKE